MNITRKTSPVPRLGGGLFVGAFLVAASALALGPHQVLLLVNENSPASERVARHYAHLRDVPAHHLVYLDVPDRARRPTAEISYDEFRRSIYEPAQKAVAQRGLDGQILAWVYSVDFPVAVKPGGTPLISLQGATYLRAGPPPSVEEIKQGTFISPFFRGPNGPNAPMAATATFDALAAVLGNEPGLPSMMLGFSGSRGMTPDEVIDMLTLGTAADATSPQADVYFVTNGNIRSTCRAWQFPRACEMLAETPLQGHLGASFPDGSEKLMGIMTGAATVDPARHRGTFLPGAMGEHLTSWAAMFYGKQQTKLTEWLRAGASGSAGTVTEPNALWTKFPNAFFYLHYVRGCSMMESFWQATYAPLQTLFVGDPLAAPYAPGLEVELRPVGQHEAAADAMPFQASVSPADARLQPTFEYYLDGRLLPSAGGPLVDIDVRPLADGYHEVRAVVRAGQPVTFQAHDVQGFRVDRQGREAILRGVEEGARVDLRHPLEIVLEASDGCRELGVLCDTRAVASIRRGRSETVSLDPRLLGEGPCRLQAFADFKGGTRVYSAPVTVHVGRYDQGPRIGELEISDEGDARVVRAAADAPVTWFENWHPDSAALPPDVSFGTLRIQTNYFALIPDDGAPYATCVAGHGDFTGNEIACKIKAITTVSGHHAQLVFGFQRPGDFGFFGLSGDHSAVVIGEYRNGQMKPHAAIGYPFRPDVWFELSVRMTDEGVAEGRVNGELVTTWKLPRNRREGRVGVSASQKVGWFRDVRLGVSRNGRDDVAVRDDRLHIRDRAAAGGRSFTARADDGYAYHERMITLDP